MRDGSKNRRTAIDDRMKSGIGTNMVSAYKGKDTAMRKIATTTSGDDGVAINGRACNYLQRLGKPPADALVLPNWDGTPAQPECGHQRMVGGARETEGATRQPACPSLMRAQLTASGMDVLTISRRLGHGTPTITLGVYGYLFANTDERAAQIIEAAFARGKTE
jgi:hypothetical protein